MNLRGGDGRERRDGNGNSNNWIDCEYGYESPRSRHDVPKALGL